MCLSLTPAGGRIFNRPWMWELQFAICNLPLVGPHMTLFLFPPTVGLSGRWCCGVKLLKTEHCGLSHDIYVMKEVGEGNGLMILSLLDYCAAMKNLGLQ